MLPLGGCNVKIVELRESEPLEVIKVSKHTTYIFPEPIEERILLKMFHLQ